MLPASAMSLSKAVMRSSARPIARHLAIARALLGSALILALIGIRSSLAAQAVSTSPACACEGDSVQTATIDSLRAALSAATARRAEPSRGRQLLNAVVLGAAFGAATGATYSMIDELPRGHEYKIPLAGAATAAGGLVLYWVLGNPFD